MSLKVYFLNSHLQFLTDDLSDVSEEQGECLHIAIKF